MGKKWSILIVMFCCKLLYIGSWLACIKRFWVVTFTCKSQHNASKFKDLFIKLQLNFVECIIKSFSHRVLFPGGGTWFNQTNGYAAAGAHIYDIAKEINDNGKHFPLFGTCLGFELLVYLSNEKKEYLATCSSQKQSLPLEFVEGSFKTQIIDLCSWVE